MNMNVFLASIKEGVVVADFGASWCSPCRTMEPIIEQVIRNCQGRATIMKIDIDSQKSLATDFMVQSIPTLILFKDGKEIKRMVGLKSRSVIEKWLNEAL
ncbi:MAG: thioredoxin [Desulfobacter sp.]|nr:MAG: thioredoxin [Desulfobacter sp.]